MTWKLYLPAWKNFLFPFLILCVWVTAQTGCSLSCPVLMLSMSRPTSQSTQIVTPTQVGSAALTPLTGCIVPATRAKAGAREIGSVWLTALVQGRGSESLPPAGHRDGAAGSTRLGASRGAAHTLEDWQPPAFRVGADTW